MKINIFLVVAILLSRSVCLSAQAIDSTMSIYNDRFTPEKIHLQTDRLIYKKGETVFYKAYLLANNYPSLLSKTLYTDWYDETGKLLLQTEAPLLISSAKGSFDIPQNYQGTHLHVKAYTRWMLNFDTAFIYNLSLTVYQPENKIVAKNTVVVVTTNTIQLQLYPEGGFTVEGIKSRVAFKASDQWDNPVKIKGVIKNSKGGILNSFTTVHDGMGVFSLLTEKDETYFLNWVDEQGNAGKKEISAQKQAGACLKVLPKNKKAIVTIERSLNAGKEFKNMHLLVHENQTLRYKLDIDMSSKTIISTQIDVSDLPTGIVQCTLFNANWVPVAERIIFVNNQNHFFLPIITVKQKDLSKKGSNQIEINVADTLLNNMSLAVTEVSLAAINGPNIFSDFLLSDEIKGKVYNAAQYFSTEILPDTTSAQLDLVMLTSGHRRFDWERITKGLLPATPYPADTNYLQIKGQVTAKKLLKSKEPLTLNVMLQTKDSVRKMFVLPVKRDGSFDQNNLFFYDTAKLFYGLNNQKNSTGAVKFEGSLMKSEDRKSFFINQQIEQSELIIPLNKKGGNKEPTEDSLFFAAQEKLQKLSALITLKTVTVKAKSKTTKQILDDYYTRGMYAGEGSSIAIDVEGDISVNGRNIWDYLQSKIPGLNVTRRGSNPEPIPLWYPNSQGIPDVPAILLDEVPISLESVSSLNISSIAYVKAFRPPFLGSMLNGFSGVIALYSKKGYSPVYSNKESQQGLETYLLNGYSKFREFIQPDYTNINSREEPDNRPTLYWNPFILTDKNNPKSTISFYNNDISKKLCIILEGINAEGKMTRVVKLVE